MCADLLIESQTHRLALGPALLKHALLCLFLWDYKWSTLVVVWPVHAAWVLLLAVLGAVGQDPAICLARENCRTWGQFWLASHASRDSVHSPVFSSCRISWPRGPTMPSSLCFRLTLGTLFLLSTGIAAYPQKTASSHGPAEPRLRSHVFVYSLADKTSREVFTDNSVWEAPNWSPDGKYLLMNHAGDLDKLVLQPVLPASSQKLSLPAGTMCNNDKSLSPDGELLAFSASTPSSPGSEVYVARSDGTNVRQVTFESPSYFHGWSPDGKTLAFVAPT